MKVFIAYQSGDEDNKTLINTLQVISDALHAAGHQPYCTHLQTEVAPDIDKMKMALMKIDDSDALLAFVQTGEHSEGMSLEIGYAYGKSKPIHVFTQVGVRLASFELADSITEWKDLDQLTGQIQKRFAA